MRDGEMELRRNAVENEKESKDAECGGSRGVTRDEDSASIPDSTSGVSIRDTHLEKDPGCNVIPGRQRCE